MQPHLVEWCRIASPYSRFKVLDKKSGMAEEAPMPKDNTRKKDSSASFNPRTSYLFEDDKISMMTPHCRGKSKERKCKKTAVLASNPEQPIKYLCQ